MLIFCPSPLEIRLSHNLIAGYLSQPEAAGVPGELLGHVYVHGAGGQRRDVRPKVSRLPEFLILQDEKTIWALFPPSGDTHIAANHIDIFQNSKLSCLAIATIARICAMSPITAFARTSLADQRRSAVTHTWRQLITTRILKIVLVAVHALIITLVALDPMRLMAMQHRILRGIKKKTSGRKISLNMENAYVKPKANLHTQSLSGLAECHSRLPRQASAVATSQIPKANICIAWLIAF